MEGRKASILSVVLCFLLISCTIREDANLKNISLRKARSLDQATLSKLRDRIEEGVYGRITSLLIIHNDALVMEEYFSGGSPKLLQPVYSVTKSVTSASVGIALEQGKIKSLDEKVLTFFPEYSEFAHKDARKEAITLEHLLTMSAGLAWDEESTRYGHPQNDVTKLYQSPDWFKFVLDREMLDEPGGKFVYNSGATVLLSGIIQHKTGLSAEEFTSSNLFKPLGISQWYWERGPNDITDTGGGLHLFSTDMAKFGQLYLNKGRWNGTQIIPEDWINRSTQKRVRVDEYFDYGYQWWQFPNGSEIVASLQTNDIYFAWGYKCQLIFVIPHLNMVVVSTGRELSEQCGIFIALKDDIFPAVIYEG